MFLLRQYKSVRGAVRQNSTLSQLIAPRLFPQAVFNVLERNHIIHDIHAYQNNLRIEQNRKFQGDEIKLDALYLDYFNKRNGVSISRAELEDSNLTLGSDLHTSGDKSSEHHTKVFKLIGDFITSPSTSYSISDDPYEFHDLSFVKKLNTLHRLKLLNLPREVKTTITDLTKYLHELGVASIKYHLYLNGESIDTKRICVHSLLDDELFYSYFGLLMIVDNKATVEWLNGLITKASAHIEVVGSPEFFKLSNKLTNLGRSTSSRKGGIPDLNTLKKTIRNNNIPLARIPPIRDVSLFNIIPIENTIINSLLLINVEVISRSSKTNSGKFWHHSSFLQSLLWECKQLGELRYKTRLNNYLQPFADRSYYTQLNTFLKSVEFYKYVIEQNGFFQHQPAELQTLLLEKRTAPSLISSQFFQMYTLTSETENLGKMVTELIEILDAMEETPFKEFYKHLNAQRFSLLEINMNRIDFKFPVIELPENTNTLELGELVVKKFTIESNLGHNLKEYLDNNKEVYEILSGHPEFYTWVGFKYLNGSTSEIQKIISSVNPKDDIKERLLRIDQSLSEFDNLTISVESPIPPQVEHFKVVGLPFGQSNLNKLMTIHYDHLQKFIESLGISLRSKGIYLPDIITTVGTYGETYYKLLISKKLVQSPQLIPIFTDKSFKFIINSSSDSLLLSGNDIILKLEEHLKKLSERNSYYTLRHQNQKFNQQIGALALTSPNLLHEWVDKWLDPIISHWGMISPSEQQQFFKTLSEEILLFNPKGRESKLGNFIQKLNLQS